MEELSSALVAVAMLMFGGGLALCVPQGEERQCAGRRLVQAGTLVLLVSSLANPMVLVPMVLMWANLACIPAAQTRNEPRVPGFVPVAVLVLVLLLLAWDLSLDVAAVAWACAIFSAGVCGGAWLFDCEAEEEDDDEEGPGTCLTCLEDLPADPKDSDAADGDANPHAADKGPAAADGDANPHVGE